MTGPILASALTTAMVAGLLVAEWSRWRFPARRQRADRLRHVTKPLASLGFVLVPIAGAQTVSGVAPVTILIGLVLGAVGDVLLLSHRRAGFLAGLTAFLLGHVAYVVAFASLVEPSRWLAGSMAVVVVAVAVACGAVLRWLWPHLGTMTVPVIAYVAVIGTMLVGAIACAHHAPLDGATRLLLTLGAVLFFASDLSVARDRFVSEGFVNRAWGLPAYYAGQLLLAWSFVAR